MLLYELLISSSSAQKVMMLVEVPDGASRAIKQRRGKQEMRARF